MYSIDRLDTPTKLSPPLLSKKIRLVPTSSLLVNCPVSCLAIIIGIVTDYNDNSLTIQWGVLASVDPAGATAAGFPAKPGGYLATTYGAFYASPSHLMVSVLRL